MPSVSRRTGLNQGPSTLRDFLAICPAYSIWSYEEKVDSTITPCYTSILVPLQVRREWSKNAGSMSVGERRTSQDPIRQR